jgi:hypothetical protein
MPDPDWRGVGPDTTAGTGPVVMLAVILLMSRRMNRTIMQTDPTARHSPIESFRRVCYLARATALIGPNLGKLVGLHGHDSGHGGVDPPPAMTVFPGEP